MKWLVSCAFILLYTVHDSPFSGVVSVDHWQKSAHRISYIAFVSCTGHISTILVPVTFECILMILHAYSVLLN